MPLLRFEVRNEYGLGNPELYAQANKEDPKAVLDGVAVAGLVGILRQLGDLAEYVFAFVNFRACIFVAFDLVVSICFLCYLFLFSV